jgi:two-component system cell cycle response regulator
MNKYPIVLVVDDEPDNVELLKAILLPLQFNVQTAANGAEALASLAREPADIVLLDVMMPLINGYEVCRRIRADRKLKGIPIILITALSETSERIMGIDAGCDEFVTKPFDKNEVVARIRTLLRLNFYRSQIDEKDKFESILNRMNEGLIVCGPDLGIRRANRMASDLLGSEDTSPEWLARLGRDFRVGYYGDLRGDIRVMELEFDVERPGTPSARPLILSFSSSLIKDPDGALSSVVILLHDVTELRRDQLRRNSFLSLMSDKLKAPLARSLQSLAAFKGATSDLSDVMEFLRMLEKIFDYLSVSAAGPYDIATGAQGGVDMERVEALVNAAVAAQTGKTFECDFKLGKGLGLPLGEDLLEIIFKNLIENAGRFTDKQPTKICFTAVKEGDNVRFSVTDNGVGVPGEERQNIFDAFYQVERPGMAKTPGLGLGLAIVKKIVETNHGDIRVDFPTAGGTTITFTLPLAAA